MLDQTKTEFPDPALSRTLRLILNVNIFYGLIGAIICFFVFGREVSLSFLFGWLIAFLNFELLKRIGFNLIKFYVFEIGGPKIIYFFLDFIGIIYFMLD
jgi:hypothetical protein